MATIVQTILTALTTFMSGIGASIVGFFDSIMVDADGALTNFATWALTFIGVGFAITFVYMLINKLRA